jgi:hypothetical protein
VFLVIAYGAVQEVILKNSCRVVLEPKGRHAMSSRLAAASSSHAPNNCPRRSSCSESVRPMSRSFECIEFCILLRIRCQKSFGSGDSCAPYVVMGEYLNRSWADLTEVPEPQNGIDGHVGRHFRSASGIRNPPRLGIHARCPLRKQTTTSSSGTPTAPL